MKIVVVDYGSGNLRSAAKALERVSDALSERLGHSWRTGSAKAKADVKTRRAASGESAKRGLRRTVSWSDASAGWCSVTVALGWFHGSNA